ncbi:MAG: sulfatase-like hydrolase/transferase [Planctomycetota bacterium]|nr:sulfatase-like hydrolase/transferase [Planctomycetota bacterium]
MKKRTQAVLGLSFALICVLVSFWGIRVYFGSPRLNVLIITLDTTRADRIGCYGYPAAQTPTIDGLASNGVLFERAYASAPLTLPSHATIFTGLNPPEHGLRANGQHSLPTDIPTLATVLSDEGYETGAFIGAFVLDSKFGLNRGFNVYDDQLSDDNTSGDELHRNRDGNLVVDSALFWLRHVGDQPFFCWVHLYDPHFQHLSHEDLFGEQFIEKPYDGEIAYVDLQIKRLVNFLKSQSLEEQTIIIVVGDHGEGLGDHGERTHSHMVYNSTMHVPLIFSSPNYSYSSKRVAEPVSLVDVYPSILDVLNLPQPRPASGRSLKPAFEGQTIEPSICYGETEEPYNAARCSPLTCITTDRWKYIRTSRPELFDLQQDPRELQNLAASQPDQMEIMENLLVDMEQQMDRRSSPSAALSTQEERALASLGYTGDRGVIPDDLDIANLPDVKDMLPYFNRCDDAHKSMHFGNYIEAAEILKPVVEAFPTYFEARCSLGVCLYKQEQYEAAIAEWERALELGAPPATVNIQLGLTRMRQEQFEEARGHFSEALKSRPDSAEVHFCLGTALKQLGRLEESLASFDKALELKPGNAEVKSARESVLALLKRPAR